VKLARAAVAVMLAAGLSACLGPVPEVPEDRFYRLGEAAAPAGLPSLRLGETVAVARPLSDGLHTERAILYAQAQEPQRIMRHHYDLWADSPPTLIQDHLVAFLRHAEVAERVVRSDSPFGSGLLIEPRLQRFERVLSERGDAVMVALEFTVRGEGEPMLTGYEVRLPVDETDMYAAVKAFEAALIEIYSRLLHDLAVR